ncbi:MAG: hypothetical protein KJ583_00195 [Nanoarchaeota archaeon]|nr:hypothetical protein [Nanoarchaeota archaeon]MBU1269417.1 hypothetical protein [Nanoarchaeota archaeon]MBU1603708.1 hypothetical protein [Nanoarchaeota archaeon]MBU2442945.1 hypothetical protein [Nanoarchaeota archaeon]
MNHSGSIIVEGDSDNIFKLFESEEKEFENGRASYSVKKNNHKIEFVIKAKDASALRAVLNSVAKNLIVYEKVKDEQGN